MTFRAKLVNSLVLASTLVVLGCQTPVAPLAPKVAVSYGSLQWSSDADLAVLLDLRPLLQARKLQATTATVLGPITTVVAKVTGPNIVGEILSPEVHTWECPGGLATLNFSHLPDGEVTVVVNAFDANHNLVKSTLPVKAQILQGHVAEVTVQCVDADGQLLVHFDCTELCGGSPTPVPSPTPTPTPTPVPTPARPSNIRWVTGFNADAQGNVYLYGTDPSTPPGFNTPPWVQLEGSGADPNQGRIVKVDTALNVVATPLADTGDFSYQGPIYQNHLKTWTSTGPDWTRCSSVLRNIDLASGAVGDNVYLEMNSAGINRGWGACTVDDTGQLYFTPGGNFNSSGAYTGSFVILHESNPSAIVYNAGSQFTNTADVSFRPITLAWDHAAQGLVWTSGGGIYKLTPGGLAQRFTDTVAYGLCLIGGSAAEMFYTTWGDTNLYYMAGGTSMVAFSFSRGYPYRVEQGADGSYYVMLTETRHVIPGPSQGLSYGGDTAYRIIKLRYDANARTAVPVQTLVDTFDDPSASY